MTAAISAARARITSSDSPVFEDQNVFDGRRWNAGRRRHGAELLGAPNDHLVEHAVISAVEDHDRVLTRHGSRNAHRTEDGFGTGVTERHAFGPGELAHQGRHFFDERMLRPDLDAAVELRLHRGRDERGRVTQEVRAIAVQKIDVFVSVQVPEAASRRPIDDDRVNDLLELRAKARSGSRVSDLGAIVRREFLRPLRLVHVARDEPLEVALLRRRQCVARRSIDVKLRSEPFLLRRRCEKLLAFGGLCRCGAVRGRAVRMRSVRLRACVLSNGNRRHHRRRGCAERTE
jgi:hypothetical protein